VFVHTGWSAKDGATGNANITALLALRNGDLWIALSDKGVSRLRDGRNSNYTDSDGLPSRAVWSLAQDLEGAIWAGTEGGLARFEHDRRQPVGALLWKKTYSPPGSRKFQTTKVKIGQT
jgi:ligand-binding sensor domain-containing protein